MGARASRGGFAKMGEAQDSRVLMVGLDCAGKTTLLHRMKQGEAVATAPTIGFNVETVQFRNMNFTVWDIGSQNDKIRPLWHHYLEQTQGLIFVVDSTDHARMEVAQAELAQMLEDTSIHNTALLVLANKQDLPGALSPDEVAAKLGLDRLQVGSCTVKPACAVDGAGLADALDWLSAELHQPLSKPRSAFARRQSSL